jgi:hypothetical protein
MVKIDIIHICSIIKKTDADMIKTLAGILLIFLALQAPAQKISMTPEKWEVSPGAAEFITHKGVPAVKINRRGMVILKGMDFTDGIIEYDMEPIDSSFTGIYFRRSNEQESEYFYFRVFRTADPVAWGGIQYAPILKTVNMWDMFPEYQGGADFRRDQWNHVKLVIAGKTMTVFVNDNTHPVLRIPYLEGDSQHGTLAFDGRAIIANVSVQKGGVPATEGSDITDNDTRYIRKWEMGKVMEAPLEGVNFNGERTFWQPVTAERKGLINLTRLYGISKPRRFIWLKTTIHASEVQKRKLSLGFSDEVWVFINGKYLYTDKNIYGAPGMKEPMGRCSLENCSFDLPLVAGDNELLIGLANDFYGWGIIARLDQTDGISIR